MRKHFLLRTTAAATATAVLLLSGISAAQAVPKEPHTPPGLAMLSQDCQFPPGLFAALLSSGPDTGTTAPPVTTTPTVPIPAPESDEKLVEVVPDIVFRRYLNVNYLDRAETPDAPTTAAEIATLSGLCDVDDFGSHDALDIPDINDEVSFSCGPICTRLFFGLNRVLALVAYIRRTCLR